MHYDQTNILNCLLRGEKRWLFLDTRQREVQQMPWAMGNLRGVEGGRPVFDGSDFVGIDPAAVDLEAHPQLWSVTMREATQGAGGGGGCVCWAILIIHSAPLNAGDAAGGGLHLRTVGIRAPGFSGRTGTRW